MINDQRQLIAYLATLLALVILVAISAWLAAVGKLTEAAGTGAAVVGLIGVLKMPPHPGAPPD